MKKKFISPEIRVHICTRTSIMAASPGDYNPKDPPQEGGDAKSGTMLDLELDDNED